ncbi:hypothetical protein [Mycobacterium intracellulare]|uniref:hypothetical protein n=1 Tax=Mycobacterium intracellulare TaxID=1767 RepID=UPI0015DDCA32|nr:hypothetical protein [Mycobacterium intracellulare]
MTGNILGERQVLPHRHDGDLRGTDEQLPIAETGCYCGIIEHPTLPAPRPGTQRRAGLP